MWLLSTTKHSFICMMFIFSLRTIHGFKNPNYVNYLFLYYLFQSIYTHKHTHWLSTGKSVFHGIKVRSTRTSWNLIIVPFATRLHKSLDPFSVDFKFQNTLQMILRQPYDWWCSPPGWTPELRITVRFQFYVVPITLSQEQWKKPHRPHKMELLAWCPPPAQGSRSTWLFVTVLLSCSYYSICGVPPLRKCPF